MTKSLEKQLSLIDGISLVVGTIIGSGIFASPGSVLRHSGSGGAALLVWTCSGLLAFCGSLCYAELATSLPSAGGEVTYLKRAYGEIVSFLFTWTNSLITRPASFGIISLIFGEYLCRIFSFDNCPDSLVTRIFAFCCSFLVFLCNAWSTRLAASALGFSTGMKITALVGISLIGLIYYLRALNGSVLNDRTPQVIMASIGFDNTTNNILDYPQAFLSALWAYDGWNGLSYASEEMRSSDEIVQVLRLAVPLITLLYTAANSAYIIGLPFEIASHSETVGVDLTYSVLGETGVVLMLLFVCVSAFGAAVGTLFQASRLVFSSSRDGQLPAVLSELHSTRGTPIIALFSQWIMTCLYLLIGNFENLVGVFGSTSWLFYFLTVLGLIKLRYTEPELQRPYKVPLSIAFLFCLVSLFLVVIDLIAKPINALIIFIFLLSGLPVYSSPKCCGEQKYENVKKVLRSIRNRQPIQHEHLFDEENESSVIKSPTPPIFSNHRVRIMDFERENEI